MIYPDTSFLVPLYTPEPQTETAQNYLTRAELPLIYTPFHRLELRTALRVRAFRNLMAPEQLRRTFAQIEADVSAALLRHVALKWSDTLRRADEIAEAHLIHIGARSSDLLHIASAVVLGASEFCTFDQRQTELAKRAGLKVRTWR